MTRKANSKAKGARNTADARWAAVQSRDPAADGVFVYAVATTGVYCRPTCPSRRAKRENVTFYASGRLAEAAGFRPCKRCKPNGMDTRALNEEKIARACRLIEEGDCAADLATLASHAGMSRYHFHRQFRAATGVTPKAYWLAHAHARVRNSLARASNVTHAVLDAGFSSTRQFYEGAKTALGMTPATFRKGGANTVIRFAVGQCSLGEVLVAASDKGVCAILLGDDAGALLRDLEDRFPKAELIGTDKAFDATVASVIAYVDGKQARFTLPLDVRGTAFQHRVWQALREIKRGKTASYSEIAAKIGKPHAVRAVAGACAANPAAVVIPCHRAVRSDGGLSGYRWGIERKRTLLEREARGGNTGGQKATLHVTAARRRLR